MARKLYEGLHTSDPEQEREIFESVEMARQAVQLRKSEAGENLEPAGEVTELFGNRVSSVSTADGFTEQGSLLDDVRVAAEVQGISVRDAATSMVGELREIREELDAQRKPNLKEV